MKKILVVADVPNWAWARKAQQLKRHVTEFDVDIVYTTAGPVEQGYDLYHTFEVFQVHQVPSGARSVTGITAHVWKTWESKHGEGTVRRWGGQANGFHANSRLLQREMESYLGHKVYYVPNGVDEEFFRRQRRRRDDSHLVVAHVGKPNPRKGRDIIAEACEIARREGAPIEFREIRRTSQNAVDAEAMRDFYQDIHVIAVASDMDGTPNPALEAASCECAVVSNRIGNMPEFIRDAHNGFIVEREAKSMAEKLKLLALDIPLAVRFGQNARATVEAEWRWRDMAKNYAAMWREVLR